jgi:hypothetical protein
LLRFGLAAANARRSEFLMLEGLTKARNWYGLAAGKASEMQAAIDKVSSSTALGRDQIAGMASELYRANLRGENFNQALEGLAIATAAGGAAQGELFKNMAIGHAFAGASVKKLANDVRARFGKVAAAQMLDLNVQTMKLRENLNMLFSGIGIETFAKAIKIVADLFSQSTASGRALKTILEVLFKPLSAAIEAAAPLAKRFFQGMVLGVQTVMIAVLRLALFFKKTFGGSELLKGLDAQKAALYAGAGVIGLMAGAALLAAAALGAMAAGFGAVAAIAGVVLAPVFALAKTVQLIRKLGWKGAGSAIVQGIVSGIKSGASWLVDAIKNLAQSGAKAFTDFFEIKSPSKKMARYGKNLAQGAAGGVQAEAPAFKSAVADMTDVPLGGAARGGGGNTTTINIGDVYLDGKRATSEQAADFRRMLEKELEGAALQLGSAA